MQAGRRIADRFRPFDSLPLLARKDRRLAFLRRLPVGNVERQTESNEADNEPIHFAMEAGALTNSAVERHVLLTSILWKLSFLALSVFPGRTRCPGEC